MNGTLYPGIFRDPESGASIGVYTYVPAALAGQGSVVALVALLNHMSAQAAENALADKGLLKQADESGACVIALTAPQSTWADVPDMSCLTAFLESSMNGTSYPGLPSQADGGVNIHRTLRFAFAEAENAEYLLRFLSGSCTVKNRAGTPVTKPAALYFTGALLIGAEHCPKLPIMLPGWLVRCGNEVREQLLASCGLTGSAAVQEESLDGVQRIFDGNNIGRQVFSTALPISDKMLHQVFARMVMVSKRSEFGTMEVFYNPPLSELGLKEIFLPLGAAQHQLLIFDDVCEKSVPLPLIIMNHGGGVNALNAAQTARWPRITQGGAYVVYPDRNALRGASPEALFDAVIGYMRRSYPIDRIFICGFSAGNIESRMYALRHPDQIAAYVGFGGVGFAPDEETEAVFEAAKRRCGRTVPALLCIGTRDTTAAYDLCADAQERLRTGTKITVQLDRFKRFSGIPVLPQKQVLYDLSDAVQERPVCGDPAAVLYRWQNSNGAGLLQLMLVSGLNHAVCTSELQAAWQFMQQH